MYRLVAAATSLLIACSPAHAEAGGSPSAGIAYCGATRSNAGSWASFSRSVQAVLDDHGIPNLAVAVVRNGVPIFAGSFRGPQGANADCRTPFHLASVSKIFVALGVMRLVERGQVQLDAPVQRYVPEFTGDDPRTRTITVSQLLTHMSGLPDVDDYDWEHPQLDDLALRRWVSSFMRGRSLASDPGAMWAYSNFGYEVLGLLIANVSGRSFESFMREEVLAPLGMRDSTFFTPAIPPGRRLVGHLGPVLTTASPVYPYNRRHAPSSTLQSNTNDMIAALRHFTHAGSLQRPVRYATLRAMWMPRMPAHEGARMGYGWFVSTVAGRPAVLHDGSDRGFRSVLVVLPDDGIGVAVFANYQQAPVQQLAELAARRALGREMPAPPAAPLARRLERERNVRGIEATLAAHDAEIRGGGTDASYDVYLLGKSLMERQEWGDAITVQRYLIALLPDEGYGYRDLGRALIGAGQGAAAIPPLERALELLPGNQAVVDMLRQARDAQNASTPR